MNDVDGSSAPVRRGRPPAVRPPLRRLVFLSAACLALASAGAASARQEGLPQGGASPGSQDSIPTDKPLLRAFCADRPGQGTLPCTVDKGRLQLETDVASLTYDRSSSPGAETYLVTNPTLKLGVTDRADVEFNIAPYEEVRRFAGPDSRPRTLSGPGDLVVRYKQNLFGDSQGPLALAISPFVKAPTARSGIGDGAWEGGVLAPFAYTLSKSLVLNLDPEVDVRKDQTGGGVHTETFGVANVTLSLPFNLAFLVEVAANKSQEAGSPTQVYSDFALSLGLRNDLEIDVGVNHGLNRSTPANQVYVGFGKRF